MGSRPFWCKVRVVSANPPSLKSLSIANDSKGVSLYLFVYKCPVWMLIQPSLFRLRTVLCHVVKTTVITRSKGLVSMKNGSHGLECDVIRFAHGRKNVQMTSFPCQFAQPATGVGQGELLINLSLFVMSLPVVGRVDAVLPFGTFHHAFLEFPCERLRHSCHSEHHGHGDGCTAHLLVERK